MHTPSLSYLGCNSPSKLLCYPLQDSNLEQFPLFWSALLVSFIFQRNGKITWSQMEFPQTLIEIGNQILPEFSGSSCHWDPFWAFWTFWDPLKNLNVYICIHKHFSLVHHLPSSPKTQNIENIWTTFSVGSKAHVLWAHKASNTPLFYFS